MIRTRRDADLDEALRLHQELGAGVPSSLWAGRVVGSLVFDVTPAGPLVIAAPITLMAIVAGVAAMVPALRASRIDPAAALRCE